jgi:hypothetical protein
MARHEQDREDLLREATALVERMELRIGGEDEPVVIGFRRDGSPSVFLGGDPVYQFNSGGRLRRAFVDGLLYKAEKGRLVSLCRQRTPAETQLVRADLSDRQQQEFRAGMRTRLLKISRMLENSQFEIVGQVPLDRDMLPRVREILPQLAAAPIAWTPRVS